MCVYAHHMYVHVPLRVVSVCHCAGEDCVPRESCHGRARHICVFLNSCSWFNDNITTKIFDINEFLQWRVFEMG